MVSGSKELALISSRCLKIRYPPNPAVSTTAFSVRRGSALGFQTREISPYDDDHQSTKLLTINP